MSEEEPKPPVENVNEEMSFERPAGSVPMYWFLIAGLMAGYCAYIFLLNIQFQANLPKWQTLFENELDVELPKLAKTVGSIGNTGFGICLTVLLLWWIIPAWLSFRPIGTQTKKIVWLVIGMFLTSTVYTLVTSAETDLKKNYAKLWYEELPKTKNSFPMASPGNLIDDFLDETKPNIERTTASARLRAWGLLIQAKLKESLEDDVATSLQNFASNEDNLLSLRFSAVHALVVIDRESTESKRAIVLTIEDCLNSDATELREMAEAYKSLPFFSDGKK